MKQYRVPSSAGRNVLGYEPGDKFSQDIPEEQERRLRSRGQLEVVGEERVVEQTGTPELHQEGRQPPTFGTPSGEGAEGSAADQQKED